jgi:hypothetical protein
MSCWLQSLPTPRYVQLQMHRMHAWLSAVWAAISDRLKMYGKNTEEQGAKRKQKETGRNYIMRTFKIFTARQILHKPLKILRHVILGDINKNRHSDFKNVSTFTYHAQILYNSMFRTVWIACPFLLKLFVPHWQRDILNCERVNKIAYCHSLCYV